MRAWSRTKGVTWCMACFTRVFIQTNLLCISIVSGVWILKIQWALSCQPLSLVIIIHYWVRVFESPSMRLYSNLCVCFRKWLCPSGGGGLSIRYNKRPCKLSFKYLYLRWKWFYSDFLVWQLTDVTLFTWLTNAMWASGRGLTVTAWTWTGEHYCTRALCTPTGSRLRPGKASTKSNNIFASLFYVVLADDFGRSRIFLCSALTNISSLDC